MEQDVQKFLKRVPKRAAVHAHGAAAVTPVASSLPGDSGLNDS